LPAKGGQIVVTAPITDPAGLKLVQTLVFHPDGSFTEITMVLVAGTTGTYRATYTAPANDNEPVDGVQAPQVYEVRVRAVDNGARVTLSKLVPFTVLGIPKPPPPG
jgi:hypothetical protein